MAKDSAPWKRVKLGEVVRLHKETCRDPATAGIERVIGLEHLEPGDLRVRSWGDVADGTTFTNRVRPGQVLFGKRRAYQRKVAVADFDAICSGDIYVFESAAPSELLPELLPFICQTDSFFEHAVGTSAGSLSPRTNWTSLAEYEFALPPMAEQRRIATLCKAATSSVERVSAAQASLVALRASMRHDLFTRGIAGGAIRAVNSQSALPTGWSRSCVGETFDILDSRRVPVKDSERASRKGPFPYYGASGIIDYVDSFIFDEPTLLLTEDGMNLLARSSPVVHLATGQYWVNNHAHVLRPRPHACIEFYREYLEHLSLLPFITGTYQKKITRSDCERIPVIVPPVEEQREIARVFAALDETAGELDSRRLATLEALMRVRDETLS